MINVIRYEELGRHQISWLDAHYHFSFSGYHDPQRMGFGPLRVINDDIVKVGGGFGTHPHNDMEIITYVRKGAITHKDSMGNVGRTEAGDVQVMSAGTGIMHSEANVESEDTNLYQIWIEPRERGVKPRWEQRKFPTTPCDDSLQLLVSGRANDQDTDALSIHQDAAIYGGRLTKGTSLTHAIEGQAYLLVSEGAVEVEGETICRGDGAELQGLDRVAFAAIEDAEIVLIEVPAE